MLSLLISFVSLIKFVLFNFGKKKLLVFALNILFLSLNGFSSILFIFPLLLELSLLKSIILFLYWFSSFLLALLQISIELFSKLLCLNFLLFLFGVIFFKIRLVKYLFLFDWGSKELKIFLSYLLVLFFLYIIFNSGLFESLL